MRWLGGIVLMVATAAAACSRAPEPKRYEVRGQILSFDPQRNEVVVDHEDIEGFMPAMVMPYKVQDPALLEGKKPGDMVTATLVVEEVDYYLTTLTTTGHEPIKTPAAGPASPTSSRTATSCRITPWSIRRTSHCRCSRCEVIASP